MPRINSRKRIDCFRLKPISYKVLAKIDVLSAQLAKTPILGNVDEYWDLLPTKSTKPPKLEKVKKCWASFK